jgi:hypothetical protein
LRVHRRRARGEGAVLLVGFDHGQLEPRIEVRRPQRRGHSAGAGPSAAGAAGRTTGQVAFLQGSTLYVTTAEGNTVKVTAPAGATVTKTVKASVGSIHPGETVVVTGAAGANGALSAESIRVGENVEAGGLSALLGAGGTSSKGAAGGAGGAGGGEPALFGKG